VHPVGSYCTNNSRYTVHKTLKKNIKNSAGTVWQVGDQLHFPAVVRRGKRDSDTSNIQGES